MAETAGSIWYEVDADTSKLVNAVKSTDKTLGGLNKTFSKTDKAANDTRFQLTKTAAAVKNLGRDSGAASAAMSALSGVLKGLLTVHAARAIIATADAWTELQNRLRQVTDGQRELNQATDDVFRIAQTTSQALEPVAQVYQRLAQNAAQLGIDQKKVAEITETVSKAVAASGASADAADAALRQLGQGLASGALRGDELNSVMEQTPALAQAIATGLGVTIGELRKLGADGKITAQSLITALTNAGESVNQQFGTRVKTAAQAWVELTNSVTRFIGETSKANALNSSLADGIERVSKAIDEVDIEAFAQEIEGLKSTVALVMDGVEFLFKKTESFAQDAGTTVERSFTDMAVTTSKEVDGIAKVFQGTAGAIAAIWEALANNIPAYFSNAWAEVKSGAAGFVNDLADLVNKPIQALGGEGIGHVSVDPAPIRAIIDLSEAAADGWKNAALGVGAYERTMDRVTKNAINSAITDWESQYTEATKKATAAAESKAAASGKLTSAQRQEAKAHEQNTKTLDAMAAALMQTGLGGEALAVAKAKAQLNVFATPEQVATVEAMARALYQVQQAKADQEIINSVDPVAAETERYATQVKAFQDMLDQKRVSQEEFDAYMAELKIAHDETMGELYTENWALQGELETARYEANLAALTEALMNEEIAYEDYYARLMALQSAHAATSQKIEQARGKAILSSVSQSFDAATAAIGSAFGQQNAMYKAMFAASKAFAIAESVILIQQALAGAWALPFPANLPAVAQVVAGTASILSNINSVAFGGGREHGGPVAASSMYRVNEGGKPEILNLANGQQFLLPNSRGEVVSNRDATAPGSGQAGTTIINNHLTFSPVIQSSLPVSDKDVRDLVSRFNDALDDGMVLRTKK